ncbi:MAG: SDR family oxidoreductase [Geminicoccaceae bacterium]|nr:SDR family oxidoreductase [Geminicoccaceae bacterium]
MTNEREGLRVAVFGATSAIAQAALRLWAARGAELFLVARDRERLDRIAADLALRGARRVEAFVADLDDSSVLGRVLEAMDAALGVPDVALVAFGTLGDQTRAARDPEAARRTLTTNFVSPAVLLTALAARFEKAGAGCLAAITSVAGDRGRASNYVYGAAKGGLQTFLEGLRHRFAGTGVRVLDIRPGPVDTPMTAHMPKSGLPWASAERVAADILRAVERGRSVLYTPWFWRWIMLVLRHLPQPLFHRLRL